MQNLKNDPDIKYLDEMLPVSEPARQYAFMSLLKKELSVLYEGRAPRACVRTYGCQMNARDSEKLEGVLKGVGYELADDEDSDLVIYNTCTVRENANMRVYGRLGQMKNIKKKHRGMMIAICGCMMQEEEEVEKIRNSYSHVDIVFGTHNIFKLAELLYKKIHSDEMVIDVWEKTDMIVEDLPAIRKYSFKSGVNIMFGCDNFCSYCIVPYVRGRERSRKPEDIIAEIKKDAADGVVEVMLLGQNVNSYGKNLDEPVSFAKLLGMVHEIDGIERIRFMTSHPKDLSDELIEAIGKYPKICPHIHLPLQSGSSRILEKMNRHYTKEQYMNLVDKIRKARPGISISTDIMVGFPGETEDDFLETMDVVEKAGFDGAFTFIYSKRSGTPAADSPDQVPEDVVHERFDRLLKLVQKKSAQAIKRFEGQIQSVLVESVDSHDSTMLTGRLSGNVLVHFKGSESLIGRIIDLRLTECRGFYYLGEMLQA